MNNNLLIKICIGESFSFYNSKELNEFVVGSRECQVTVKASGVESYHLKFTFLDNGWYVQDISHNGLSKLNKKNIRTRPIRVREGDTIEIYGDNHTSVSARIEVLKKITARESSKLDTMRLTGKNEYILGRSASCDIVIDNPRLENQHCKFIYDGQSVYLEDLHSFSGTFVNNNKIRRALLNNYDRISVAGAAFTFYDFALLSSKSTEGIEIEAVCLEKYFKSKKGAHKVLDNVSFSIGAGEFTGIIGGEGAGKTVLLKSLTGEDPCAAGKVLYDGNNYYDNINSYKGVTGRIIGDKTIYSKKTVLSELIFRSKDLIKNKNDKTIVLSELEKLLQGLDLDKRKTVSSLNKKDLVLLNLASVLIRNPKILFMDNPSTGLSAENDLALMELYKKLSQKGKTILLATDQTENIDLCDKVAVMGCGKLCFFGTPLHIYEFFGENKLGRIFRILAVPERAAFFAEKNQDYMALHSTDSIITQAIE